MNIKTLFVSSLVALFPLHSQASGSYNGGGSSHSSSPATSYSPRSNTQSYQPRQSTGATPSPSNNPTPYQAPPPSATAIQRGGSQASSDQFYELGKYIFTGRSKKIGKFNYCFDTGTAKPPVKQAKLQRFKGQSAASIADRLYDCDSPNIKVSNYMQEKHLQLVVYYLNVRYAMGLTP